MNINALHESRKFLNLEDIFARDDSGLLDNIKIAKKADNSNNMLVNQFNDIIKFYETNKRKPNIDSDDFDEELLAIALDALKNNPDQKAELKTYDEYGLLDN